MTTAVHIIVEGGAATAALHPLRREILGELAEPDSAAGLARRMSIPRQQVNYHIRQLEVQGLVKSVGERRARNCIERLVQAVGRSYMISPAALGGLAANPEQIEDQTSDSYLLAVLSQVMQEVAGLHRGQGPRGEKLRTSALQADVHFESRKAEEAFMEELAAEMSRLVDKYQLAGSSEGRTLRLVVGTYPARSNVGGDAGSSQRGGGSAKREP
jgi:DNA-binding transcriptional ArsR family regulator